MHQNDIEKRIIKTIEDQIATSLSAHHILTVFEKINVFTAIDNMPIDSLDLVEIVTKIEDDYKINIEHHECASASTVRDIVNIVRVKTNKTEGMRLVKI